MSVIGRLDKQVEEVLIAPIARRHERKNREQDKEKTEAQIKEETQTAVSETDEKS